MQEINTFGREPSPLVEVSRMAPPLTGILMLGKSCSELKPILAYSQQYLELRVTSFELAVSCPAHRLRARSPLLLRTCLLKTHHSAQATEYAGRNCYQHQFQVYLRYTILSLHLEYGTAISIMLIIMKQ